MSRSKVKSHYQRCRPNVRRLIDDLRAGEKLVRQFVGGERGGPVEAVYSLYPSNKRVNRSTAEAAVRTVLVEPAGDGLFDAGTSQTYRAVRI